MDISCENQVVYFTRELTITATVSYESDQAKQ